VIDLEHMIWHQHFAVKQAGRDGEAMGPSASNDCFRQQAYRQLGVPVDTVQSTEKADAGSLIHYGIGAILSEVEGVEVEVPVVVPGLSRPGSADIVVWDEFLLGDIKTMGSRAWQARVDAGGPYPHVWNQLLLYALGLNEVKPGPWLMQVLAINRDTGERIIWSQLADMDVARGIAEMMRGRQADIDEAKASVEMFGADPVEMAEQFPQEGNGPGRGFPCDPWCGFLATCWPGGGDGLSPQAVTIVDNPEKVAEQAAIYLEASQEESAAKKRKYDAAAFLKGVVGTFGGFTVAQTKDGAGEDVPDVDAMIEVMTASGLPIPTLYKPGRRGYARVGRVKK
jgi:hypothetical protein